MITQVPGKKKYRGKPYQDMITKWNGKSVSFPQLALAEDNNKDDPEVAQVKELILKNEDGLYPPPGHPNYIPGPRVFQGRKKYAKYKALCKDCKTEEEYRVVYENSKLKGNPET